MQNASEVIEPAARFVRAPSRIEYSLNAGLPKLAWVATLAPNERQMVLVSGRWSRLWSLAVVGGWVLAAPAQAATIVAYDGANSPTTAAASEWLAGVRSGFGF